MILEAALYINDSERKGNERQRRKSLRQASIQFQPLGAPANIPLINCVYMEIILIINYSNQLKYVLILISSWIIDG